METENIEQPKMPKKDDLATYKSKTVVYTVRDWKEYLGEALLIIFSVLLALIMTEYISNLREKENTRDTLRNISAELSYKKKQSGK